ncbi:MAG: hypothetical protein P1U70_27925, partial [Saprospiraceae bacterium]|nr:hypothetical protein [Saprospiraceae bacterium]
DTPNSTIPEYNVVRDLLIQSGKDDSIKLRTYSKYVLELAYQVRSALLLIPFEEVGFFQDGYSSSNVFFRYYLFLRENDLLDPDVESFENFMEGFDVFYDDLFEYKPLDRIAEVFEAHLVDVGVEVEFFDDYETSDLFNEFESISSGKRGAKPISNDVQMIAFLSDKRSHELEPYFVTYDSVFVRMRDYAFNAIRRPQFWHLYFPSRFVAHLNMLNFRIDAKSFTDDFISILSKTSFIDETSTLADVMSDFMDIRSDSKRVLIKRLREFNTKYLTVMSSADTEQEQRSDFNPVAELLKNISYHYRDKKVKYNLLEIKRLILNPDKISEISDIFDRALDFYSQEKIFYKKIYLELEKLL